MPEKKVSRVKSEELYRHLTERKREESQREAARDALAQQNDALSKLNHFSIELSMLSSEDNLEALIAKRIKEIAGAVAAIFFVFNPKNRTTTTQHIEMDPGLLEKVVSLLGKQVEKIHATVSDEMYRKVTTEIIGMRKTLHDVTFGAVSRPVGAAIKALLKADRFIGVAYLIEGKLYGTSLLAMSKGLPDPPKQILESFILLAAVSLRRKQAESQRKAALEALQVSLEKYRVLFELFPLGITITDKSGKIIEANRQSEQLLGITREVQAQRRIDSDEWQIIRKDGMPMCNDEYASTRALRENRLIENVEMGIVKDKGEITWINVTATPISLEGYGVAITYGDITERKRAEETLRESEVRYRELFENINSGVAVYTVIGNGQDFIFKEFNRAGEKIDHDQRERLIDKSIFEVRPDIEQFGLIEVFRKVWRTGEPAYHPVTLYQDGKLSGWYENHVYKLPSGEIVAVFENVTERKRAEETLRSSEGLLQKIFDILPIGLWFADKDGKLLRGNPTGVKIWGAEPKVDPFEYGVFKARRLPSGEEVAPDDWALAHTIRDKVTIIDELLEIDAFDGQKKTILNYTAPVLDAKGDVQGAIMVNQDITERKRAEETLRESERNLKEAQRLGRIGHWEFDPGTQQIHWSDMVFALYERDPKLGPPSAEEEAAYYSAEDAELLRNISRRTIETGEPYEVDVRVRLPGGRYAYVVAIGTPVKDAHGRVVKLLGTIQDITERKKSEDDLHESESRLRSLSAEITRVEESERKRLAIYLHDEIGQSLAVLRMKFGGLAGSSKSKSEKHNIKVIRDLLETIIEQTHTLTFELSPPVLHQLGLEAAIEWAGEKISRDHGLDFTFNDDGMAKSLNPDLQAILFRCVRELMLNTVKHAKAKRLTVVIAREGEKILYTIADDGLGFDPSLHDTRTEETGFGLLSVREHLATMGGTCRIQSTPGQGTRITLTVPVGGGGTPEERDAACRIADGSLIQKNEP